MLVSYAGAEAESSMAVDLTGVRRIYALAHLSSLDETFQVERVKSVPYQSVCTLLFIAYLSLSIFCRLPILVLPHMPGFDCCWKGF